MLPLPLGPAGAETIVPSIDPTLLEAAQEPRLSLLWGARAPTHTQLGLLTYLAAQGQSIRVFDGGNCFDGYFVARLARRLSPDPYAVLDRIKLSRAFTCFQLAQLVENSPAQPRPLVLLNLLDTFYDESVSLREVERLLANTLTHLKRLAAVGPVLVGTQEPRTLVKDRWSLLDQLQAAADNAWLLRPPQEQPPLQPPLFQH
ncbi:MAG: hypothetical protein ACLFWD_00740 [Anaerolineales bacterium]